MSYNQIPKQNRNLEEIKEGDYDEDGFYNTPNGSKNLAF